jgi:NADPH-dependent 2,4-dienoyl-CoA reductase/sulfur reductase-like enzyme
VEVAASLAQVGMHVDLIQSRPTVWPRIAGEQTGAFLARRLKAAGVRVHDNVRAVRLEGDGRVQRVVLSDDTVLTTDFAVAAVGSQLNREILRNTPIAAENAVLTDAFGRTNIPNVYAAGDCAAIFDERFGKHRAATHWDHARATGRVCGINMAGGSAKYEEVTHFTSEVAGLTVHVWGESRFATRRLMRGNALADDGDFAEFGIAEDGRVAQVITVGRNDEHATFERMVANRVNVTDRCESLKDPAAPIE